MSCGGRTLSYHPPTSESGCLFGSVLIGVCNQHHRFLPVPSRPLRERLKQSLCRCSCRAGLRENGADSYQITLV